jgi:hypothetical protein
MCACVRAWAFGRVGCMWKGTARGQVRRVPGAAAKRRQFGGAARPVWTVRRLRLAGVRQQFCLCGIEITNRGGFARQASGGFTRRRGGVATLLCVGVGRSVTVWHHQQRTEQEPSESRGTGVVAELPGREAAQIADFLGISDCPESFTQIPEQILSKF